MHHPTLTRRQALAGLIAAGLAPLARAVHAEDAYPSRPTTLMVGFSAGGAVDLVARQMGESLGKQFGQTYVIENRPGATGTIAAEAVARAKPDGYTLLLGTQSTMVVAPSLYPGLRFDPLKDFVPISLIASVPLVLVVNPALPLKTVKDVIQYARERKGDLVYASSGLGGPQHVSMELFCAMAGVKMVHVPYKGEANAISDLLGNQVPLMFSNLPTLLPHIRAGKLRAIAVSSLQRADSAPEIPTVAESGLPGFEALTWFGLYGPAGTPQAAVARLEQGVRAGLQDSGLRAKLHDQGMTLVGSGSSAFREYMVAESRKWGDLIQKAGIKPE
ncbi:LacI family transcriptional regulator [Bordetella genomosp. 9]|uniref:Bug family tripartite tricarboxylate transporter substrate binding protein n=1 Tax=Bordetella genomosp. 9 TaxID=1416803 RepID=UPI000A2976F4|nr:tripartite tricarboxylate transporter substrate binding protein [Bordetella genomosp. 9]ARP89015.1 LacI family transcriptional regulator [Bordetella genomosp. 9]